jgi:hypothetical protein
MRIKFAREAIVVAVIVITVTIERDPKINVYSLLKLHDLLNKSNQLTMILVVSVIVQQHDMVAHLI